MYICPAGQKLTRGRTRKEKGQIVGYDYFNYDACRNCDMKSRCTRSKKGRRILRHVDQDFLDNIDYNTELNKDKYKLRQMIVEHPFGTIKRSWGAYYFLTRRKISVTAEVSLVYLAYNFRRAINILGPKEILRRLKEREKPALI
ncbi:MAG: hypothetical protein GX750_01030 [Clostridia bacterium]|nr:hypothetical protein [Clostridia bacterium]